MVQIPGNPGIRVRSMHLLHASPAVAIAFFKLAIHPNPAEKINGSSLNDVSEVRQRL
jgi:hypothetical protein